MTEDQEAFTIEMERVEDYKFRVDFDKESMGELITDESKAVGGDESGPNPSRLLAVSSLNCLMSSLVFCLKKKRVDIDSLKGKVTGTVERKDGHLRVTNLDVKIVPGISEDDEEKLKKCIDIFEDYCVVTESIRNGIEVDVDVEV